MSELAAPRLFGEETPEGVVAAAERRHGPFVHRVCLFSGGNDSLATAHRCRDLYETLVWIDTGTALPGVAEFVREAAEWIGKPLKTYAAPDGEYRRIVLGGTDHRGVEKQPLGFPGPMQHTRCYVNLKERAIEAMKRELKGEDRSARVLALTGLRRGESKRRSKREPITRRGSLVFCNPLIDWTNADLYDYRDRHDLIESDVAALTHRSGECNCGAYATPGEREMLRDLFPEWFEATIAPLEREAARMGLPCARWGAGRDLIDRQKREREREAAQVPGQIALGEGGELCADCELRLDAA